MDPPLIDGLQWAYDVGMRLVPEGLRQYSLFWALTFGVSGTATVLKGIQRVSRRFPKFDDPWLPTLEKIGMVGLSLAPFAWAAFDHEGLANAMTNHDEYMIGLAGAWATSMGIAARDLYRRAHSPESVYRVRRTRPRDSIDVIQANVRRDRRNYGGPKD